jgi:hypothetical protein
MNKYDLRNPEELGRLAKCIGKLVGPNVNFVIAYDVDDDLKPCHGAMSNVDPQSSAKMMARAGMQFLTEQGFIETEIRDN